MLRSNCGSGRSASRRQERRRFASCCLPPLLLVSALNAIALARHRRDRPNAGLGHPHPRTARRKYFRAVRLFQRLFKDYGACTRARKLAMRSVWDACEGKAEETFATNLRKAAEAAALRAKEDPRPSPRAVSMTGPPTPRSATRASAPRQPRASAPPQGRGVKAAR